MESHSLATALDSVHDFAMSNRSKKVIFQQQNWPLLTLNCFIYLKNDPTTPKVFCYELHKNHKLKRKPFAHRNVQMLQNNSKKSTRTWQKVHPTKNKIFTPLYSLALFSIMAKKLRWMIFKNHRATFRSNTPFSCLFFSEYQDLCIFIMASGKT